MRPDPFTRATEFIEFYGLIFAIFAIFLLLLVNLHSKKKAPKKAFGELEIAKKKNAHGVIFGKLKGGVLFSPVSAEGHIACFGGSGL